MRSSLVVTASDCQCTGCNGPGFDPSIRRHSGIWGAADEAVLNIVRTKKKKSPKKILKKKKKKKDIGVEEQYIETKLHSSLDTSFKGQSIDWCHICPCCFYNFHVKYALLVQFIHLSLFLDETAVRFKHLLIYRYFLFNIIRTVPQICTCTYIM
jgi:hypothetical protein